MDGRAVLWTCEQAGGRAGRRADGRAGVWHGRVIASSPRDSPMVIYTHSGALVDCDAATGRRPSDTARTEGEGQDLSLHNTVCLHVGRSRSQSVRVGRVQSVGRSVHRPIGLSVGGSSGRYVGRSVGCSVSGAIGRWIELSTGRSVGRWVDQSVGRSVGRSLGWSVQRSVGL